MVAKRKLPPDFTQRNDNCQLCSNWKSAEHPCRWGSGPVGKIMVISDAPTQTSNLGGQGGKLLHELLATAKIDSKDCYFTTLIKCCPEEGHTISAVEAKTCKQYLDAEMAQVKPKFILTLGAVVLKALTRKAKITEMHGQVVSYQGAMLMPSFAPAMALRDPTRLPGLRKDIVKFGNLVLGAESPTEDMHWEVIRTLDQWNTFIEEFSESEEVAIDCETTGLDCEAPGGEINSIQFSLSATDKNWSLPLMVRDSPWREKPKLRQEFIDTVVDLSEGKVIIGQNFKFDNRWLKKKYGRKFYLRFDTMLAHHLLDENSPHGLKELAIEFCNAPSYDVDLKTKLGLGDLEKFYKYGCFDTHFTRMLYYIFRARIIKDPSQRKLFYKLVMPVARMFEDIEGEGHHINLTRMEEARIKLVTQRDNLLEQMTKLAGREVNWNSPAQVGQLFYKELGLPVFEKTGKGAPSTGESALLQLQHRHELPKMLMEFRGVDKNLSTYVDGWKALMHGDRLFISTKLHGTVTGRYSSRLHQVPRDILIRSLIGAPDGWTFVSADFSQIELRIAAMLSNDQRMKMTFQTGGDIHSQTASAILGKPIDKLTKEERKMAKATNFGFLYSMSAAKFTTYARDNYGVNMSDQDSKNFRERFFETYSALRPWHERQRRLVRAFGQVVSLSGRIRHLPGIGSSDKGVRAEAERQAINSPVQGFGSGDLKAMAMIEIHAKTPREHVMIKGEVHDSILLWVKTDQLERYLPVIKSTMEAPSLLKDFGVAMQVPLVADVDVGDWGLGKAWKPS